LFWSANVNISFNNALGIHTDALAFRARRAEVLANNLINGDTPNFKARDIRFSDALKREQSHPVGLRRTNAKHLAQTSNSISSDKLYRTPLQPSIDGNTVDAELEESKYMRNALEFQASFTMLNGKFRGLAAAIRGE
jgi:flagellar basal-body rod protein FlgB